MIKFLALLIFLSLPAHAQLSSRTAIISDGQTSSGVEAKVASDGTDNRLFVNATITGNPSGGAPTTSTNKNLRFRDINATSGDGVGKARDTVITATFTTLWKKTGKGLIYAWGITMESPDSWTVRLIIDGTDDILISSAGLVVSDVINNSIYNLKSSNGVSYEAIGIYMVDDTLFFNGPNNFPLEYLVSVEIQVKAASKKFKGGFIHLTEVP